MKKIGYKGIPWDISEPLAEAARLGIVLCPADDTSDCDALWGEYSIHEIEAAEHLSWFQSTWAGIDSIVHAAPFCDGTAALCTSSGAYNRTIAEYLLGGCILLLRHFDTYRDAQRAHIWHKHIPAGTLSGKQITVLGMGNIGRTFAGLAEALGASVTGVRRSNIGSLRELLPGTDILVVLRDIIF